MNAQKNQQQQKQQQPQVTLIFTRMYNEAGEPLCTCGSGEPWYRCQGHPEYGWDYCG
jgi:hypothetical protein